MATSEFDLDTNGSLMEEIQKLIAPPGSEEAPKRRRGQYRRTGRAVNHDYCDSCKEGGDLLCCDHCPAAFHLQCHNPPLDEEELPPGEWMCHRCKVAPQREKDDDTASTNSGYSRGSGSGASSVLRPYSPSELIPLVKEPGDTPMDTLARAAYLMNPEQFELPKDLTCNVPFPGTSKRRYWGRDKGAPPKKPAHEMANGVVPLPARVCFICTKSCRCGPLLQCDYCPLLYHLDCLSPPLTTMPTGRWMCPNHAENLLDEKLLRTLSICERVQLWDQFTDQQVNQHTVKIAFLKKVHRQHPPFRIKMRLPSRKRTKIPAGIKNIYHHPPSLLPLPPRGFQHLDGKDFIAETTSDQHATLEEQEEWLTSVVSLQSSIAKYLAQKQMNRSMSSNLDASTSDVQAAADGLVDPLRLNVESGGKPTMFVPPLVHRGSNCDSSVNVTRSDCLSSADKDKESLMDIDGVIELSAISSNSPDGISVCNGPASTNSDTCSNSHSSARRNSHNTSNTGGAVSLLNGDIISAMSEKLKVKSDNQFSFNKSKSASIESESSSHVPSTHLYNHSAIVNQVSDNQLCTRTNVQSPSSQTLVVSSSPLLSTQTVKTAGHTVSILSGRSNNLRTVFSNGTATLTKVNSPSLTDVSTSSSAKASLLNSVSASMVGNLHHALQGCTNVDLDPELDQFDDRLLKILAWQRLQQLLPNISTPSTSTKQNPSNSLVTSDGQEVQSRALLCPLSAKGQPVSMPYRTLWVGTSSDMDVCLGSFGYCNYVSSKHACIFYDEISRHFELLNYSEHGTTVDNVLYSCDFSDKPFMSPKHTGAASAIRSLIGRSRGRGGHNRSMNKEARTPKSRDLKQQVFMEKERERNKDRPMMCSKAYQEVAACNCNGNPSRSFSGTGWEGTAVLYHGSVIKMGCLHFVFSIVEKSPNINKKLTTDANEKAITSEHGSRLLSGIVLKAPLPKPT